MPCSDKDDCKHEGQNVSVAFATADHSEHGDDDETCPPFCVCACCGQTYILGIEQCKMPIIAPITSKEFPVYTASFLSEVYFNIWQPPKVV